MPSIPDEAYLIRDGVAKRCCVHCALTLEREGMLTRTMDWGDTAAFIIREPHTFEECREFIKHEP